MPVDKKKVIPVLCWQQSSSGICRIRPAHPLLRARNPKPRSEKLTRVCPGLFRRDICVGYFGCTAPEEEKSKSKKDKSKDKSKDKLKDKSKDKSEPSSAVSSWLSCLFYHANMRKCNSSSFSA